MLEHQQSKCLVLCQNATSTLGACRDFTTITQTTRDICKASIICNQFTAKSPPSRLSANRNIEEGTLRHFGGHIGLVLGSNATSCHIPSKCHYFASSFPCLEQASPANEFEDASVLWGDFTGTNMWSKHIARLLALPTAKLNGDMWWKHHYFASPTESTECR